MRTIVIEGPDGSGKSTLINALKAADENLEAVHPGKPPTNYESLLAMMNAQMTYTPDNMLVYDRITAISESVYRPFRLDLKGDPENECAAYFSMLEAQLALALNLDWIIIYCRPSTEAIIRQCKQYNENDTEATKRVVEQHIHDVITSYDALMARLECYGCKIIMFNYEVNSTDEMVKAIIGD